MNFKSLHLVATGVCLWSLFTASLLDPNNPPTAKTGAPGETTCSTQSGCHTGGNFMGTVSISGVPDTVVPNQSYTITLKNESNATRAGFQLTCLDGNNAKCGSITAGTGVNVTTVSSTGRQYARQSSPKTLSAGSASWSFTWKAPATAVGNKATFYFVSLAANNNNQRTGDNAFTATKNVVLQNSLSPTQEAGDENWLDFRVVASDKTLRINLLGNKQGQLALFDMAGKAMLSKSLETSNTVPLGEIKSGIYVAHIASGGKMAVKKFSVNNE